MLNPKMKTPLNATGVILIVSAFLIHMAAIAGYQLPDRIVIAAIFFYPAGFILFLLNDKTQK
jgi:hypothetical protein